MFRIYEEFHINLLEWSMYGSNPQLRNQTAYLKIFGILRKVENRQFSTANSFNSRCNLCIEEKISIINFKDPDDCLMHVINWCLNVDIKVNLNYLCATPFVVVVK